MKTQLHRKRKQFLRDIFLQNHSGVSVLVTAPPTDSWFAGPPTIPAMRYPSVHSASVQ